MSIPKYDELINPTLQALHELGGSATISEMENAVAIILNLSESELNEIHRGNCTKLSYRLAWARYYLKKFNLLDNSSRGVWSLTSIGRKTTSVDKEEVKRTAKKVKTKNDNDVFIREPENDDGLTSDSWQDELLEILLNVKPDGFERLCKRLLRELGFAEVEVTGKSGDGGIDGKGIIKIGGVLSFHVVFQCKRYRNSVSSAIVRDFRGAMMGRADRGLILTTGRFTRDAKAEATRDGATPIDLMDGDDLIDHLKELQLGINTSTETQEIVTIDEDWFKEI